MGIILATSSPYRKEAFSSLGLEFEAVASAVDEQFPGRPERPEDLVRLLSRLKAEAVAKKYGEGIIIGLDSVGYFSNVIMEKPRTTDEVKARLKALSGNSFQFYTGIHMISNPNIGKLARVVKTDVLMRKISDKEIKRYLEQDRNFNSYALGFNPLGYYSISFIREIRGSYNNLLRGIPLEEIVDMLIQIGYKL